MQLLPLDETSPPAILMGMMAEHKAAGWKTPIWDTYKKVSHRIATFQPPWVYAERGRWLSQVGHAHPC
jgi:hypothetical protein